MNPHLFTIVGVFTLFVSGVAVAQETPGATNTSSETGSGHGIGYDSGMVTGEGWGSGRMGSCGASAAGDDIYARNRLASLRSELKITANQEKAWNAYAKALLAASQVMTDIHRQMIGATQHGAQSSMTVVDLDIDANQSQLPAVAALKPAAIALYSSLSDEQKRIADARLPAAGCI